MKFCFHVTYHLCTKINRIEKNLQFYTQVLNMSYVACSLQTQFDLSGLYEYDTMSVLSKTTVDSIFQLICIVLVETLAFTN